ncbi:MAG: ArsR family transcriptional regulator [Sediminibacterium sp. Gen4]|jgi:DNA-binding transcriptional regulator GbsR (MarR family)/SOS-response transcriptional repressor LexA|uniref:ArsR family transcriptional regulator n=1 Tax=unclassified Sediminibacterium TaxID=2635961 RepID=UPI0015B9E2DE|nr:MULTISPECIES: ArsR family transcriptional regulator [unclassified Sediminibacterium]MBW0164302.1 ArsR family transcriptional regulator [Sediminibacterium sp.]NWK66551.1 ArsR family transcriptional regulator [Sediminibacterium sp. Gen4]
MFYYNPDRKSKHQLLHEFVIRTDAYNTIMTDLETSQMNYPEQNYLIVGQRGAGKTTLLNRIKYGIEDSEKLKNWLLPVMFSEEQYNITELSNVWENTAIYLEDHYGFDSVVEEINEHATKKDFEEIAFDIIEKKLALTNKKIILLIDNIGDLLKKISQKEVHRLREILQTKSFIRIIAGSPFYLENILNYQKPFFEFFKVIRLNGLNKFETEDLLLALGELNHTKEKIEKIISETPERIEVLRTITGGVPRTIALLFKIFIDNEYNDSVKDLEQILDIVTPLYKHRMDDLAPQQQKIIDSVARKWDPISVKELSENLRIPSKTISAQLNQLEKEQIIEKRKTNSKNHLYLIKERFWNIWFLMRYGRKETKERVIWLVKFLESWCNDADIENRIIEFTNKVKNKNIEEESALFFKEVYSGITKLTFKAKLALQNISNTLQEKTKTTKELTQYALNELDNKEFSKAILWISKIENLTSKEKIIVIRAAIGANEEKSSNADFSFARNVFESYLNSLVDFSELKTNDNLTVSQAETCIICFLVMITEYLFVAKNPDGETLYKFYDVTFNLISEIFSIKEKNQSLNLDLSIENKLLLLAIQKTYALNLLDVVCSLFEKDYEINGSVFSISKILEPMYFAILIILGKKEYIQIPSEKEEVIRNIVDQIKSK